MRKLFKLILGTILVYIGGKMVYKELKPEKPVVERRRPLSKLGDDIEF